MQSSFMINKILILHKFPKGTGKIQADLNWKAAASVLCFAVFLFLILFSFLFQAQLWHLMRVQLILFD